MHSIRHPKNGADLLVAQFGPLIYDVVYGDIEQLNALTPEPTFVCEFPTTDEIQAETSLPRRMDAIEYDELTCNFCGANGTLDIEWYVDDELRGGQCPNCKGTNVVAAFADSC